MLYSPMATMHWPSPTWARRLWTQQNQWRLDRRNRVAIQRWTRWRRLCISIRNEEMNNQVKFEKEKKIAVDAVQNCWWKSKDTEKGTCLCFTFLLVLGIPSFSTAIWVLSFIQVVNLVVYSTRQCYSCLNRVLIWFSLSPALPTTTQSPHHPL